jgi:glutamate racemase
MDSGVGGLSVLNTLLSFNVPLNIHYVADTAFMPYGSKTVTVLRSHLIELFKAFESRWGKGIPIALCCNTASVVMEQLPWASVFKPPFNLHDIITPTTNQITTLQQQYPQQAPQHLGLLATELTIQSGVYPKRLQQQQVTLAQFTGIPCPQLAASIEGQPNIPPPEQLLQTLLAPLNTLETPLDALILGCTHYQFVADIIQKQLPQIPLISQATVMAGAIATLFNIPLDPVTPTSVKPTVTIWSTGNPNAFQPLIPKFLPLQPDTIVHAF